ncbi:MAG: prepilin-type N-terminal cleavage/methylation domain-containing protein [Sedimentisphaerales bacterium]|nr:prepilin-type N-terminal cleavage/methylation domain-containing protein [Sedimentisphaerales bacterium]
MNQMIISKNTETGRGVSMRPARAFTLIELLVVITVIGILLAVLTPALKKAKEATKKLICASNVRQFGIALGAYTMEHEERLPPSSCHMDHPEQYWLHILAAYSDSDLLYRCPSDTSKDFIDWDRPLEEQEQDGKWSSYAINSLLDPRCPLSQGRYNKVSNIRHPQYCIYLCEAPDSWTSFDHLHPENWGSIDEVKGQIAWDRHDGKSNYVFVDGHAECLSVDQTWAWPGNCFWFPGHAPGWPPDDF